ncbi:MAG: response regulator [Deltaproteobacteria bacterium]|nr:MAG: response regulator [Deltaproteobacteria bacterium]
MVGIDIVNFPNTVLIVDDEPIVVQVLQRVLPRQGLRVTSVSNAEEATDVLQRENFGCMLVDKNLPGKDGLVLISEVRKLQPHCACIVMTAYASTASAVEALRLGAADYLEKPFHDIELVAEKVRRAIEHQRAESDRARFLARLREFESELDKKESEVSQQRTEIEMFNEVLEARVEQATRDLKAERDELVKRLDGGTSRQNAEIVGVEMALMLLEDLQARPGLDVAPFRGELQRVVRQLQAHVRRLRGDQAA